jgi:ABC-2 type transport system ATP-binding protein
LDEAERCHSLAILDQGRLVASGTPSELAEHIDAQVLLVQSTRPRAISKYLFPEVKDEMAGQASAAAPFVHSTAQIGNTLRVLVDRDLDRPEEALSKVLDKAGLPFDDCSKVRPSLEDVFVAATQARKRRQNVDEQAGVSS